MGRFHIGLADAPRPVTAGKGDATLIHSDRDRGIKAEGYLILASGPPHYLDMAANLAASIKVMDPSRPICVARDVTEPLPPDLRHLFDDVAVLRPDPAYSGFMNKLRVHGIAPYARTMLVDADCLLVKRDVGRYWDQAAKSYFTITGGKRTTGEWKGADIAALLRQEGAPYLIQMNSGVFCYDDSAEAASFFAGLQAFYLARRKHLAVGLHRGQRTQTDEIYIGLYMGLRGMDTGSSERIGDESWMVSTWRAFGMHFEPARGVSVIRKPRRAIAGVPHPFGGWDKLSPTFAHFIGLKPRRVYRPLAARFRAEALGSP